jgi:hypothetical protein
MAGSELGRGFEVRSLCDIVERKKKREKEGRKRVKTER